MRRNFRFFAIFALICNGFTLFSQEFDAPLFKETKINSEDSNKLFLGIENNNFIKNNEYFNKFYDGYTLIGYFITPKLIYHPTHNTKIEAGVHLLKYSGLNDYTQALPVLSFQYKISNHIDMVLGTLYGTLNHKLIEPIFQFERYYENNVENGLQFLFNYRFIESDNWFNWEKFIFKNSPYKEEFTFGSSNKIKLTGEKSHFTVSIPVQLLVAHRGGQIDTANTNLQTISNSTAGLTLGYHFKKGFIKYIGLDNYYLYYKDLATSGLAFKDGSALYSNLNIESKHFFLMLGYWKGHEFIAPRGEPLFQSISEKDPNYFEHNREIITGKLSYNHSIYKDIKIGVRFESYYDLPTKNFDFAYGVFIKFERNFFLKKL
jgi:hypothetical protein